MYTNTYNKKPERIVIIRITAVKILTIAVTLLSSFVIPAILYERYIQPESIIQATPNIQTVSSEQGNVAGASTSRSIDYISERGLNLQDQNTQFLMLGIGFISIAFVILLYLIIDSKKYKKHIEVDYFE